MNAPNTDQRRITAIVYSFDSQRRELTSSAFEMYAVAEGVEWMILTNGQVWQVYHLTAGLLVVMDLAFGVDLLGEGGPAAKADTIFYLSREAFRRRLIDGLWKAKAATAPKSLAAAITSDVVLEQIRKKLRRQTSHNADAKELCNLIRATVLLPDVIDTKLQRPLSRKLTPIRATPPGPASISAVSSLSIGVGRPDC